VLGRGDEEGAERVGVGVLHYALVVSHQIIQSKLCSMTIVVLF
jgi:hypothetical protein